jgi:Fe-S-cluster containining protein
MSTPPFTPASEQTRSVAAGEFGEWLAETRAALRGGSGMRVPCGDCIGCCVSSYFIPVRPEDRRAFDLIPDEWLARTHTLAGGHWVMGYRADGTCPMLTQGKCTIYADRPQTCRDYDCRVFTAAGIEAGGTDKEVINRRVREWRFEYPSEADVRAQDAVRAAAAFIRDKRASFPDGRAPTSPTGIAVLAVKTYTVFLEPQAQEKGDEELARAVVEAARAFDSRL